MEGVGTSTAGFIGMAEKGKVSGTPEFVTSFADFNRKFGGYLPETTYGEYRYLAYAVEQFFANGGSRCYVMRTVRSRRGHSRRDSQRNQYPGKEPRKMGQ